MNNYPLVKFVIFFIIGIFCSINFEWNSKYFVVLFFISIISSISFEYILSKTLRFKKVVIELTLLFAVFFSGVSILIIQKDSNKSNYYPNVITLINGSDYSSEVRLLTPIKLKSNYVYFEGEVETLICGDSTFKVSGKALIYLELDSNSINLIPDDHIIIHSNFLKVKSPQNPAQFDYSQYLRNKQIGFSSFVNSDWKYLSNTLSIKRLATICKVYCLKAFENTGLKNEEFAIATALTFGYRDNLDNNIKQTFASTGTMHVLAVSGLHVGILYLIVLFLFRCINISTKSSWIASFCLLLIIWFFAFITGLSSSVSRAVTMFSFFIIGDLFNKSSNGFNLLSASAILLLIFNPFLITQVSFQLSYFAVLGILYLNPKIEKLYVFQNWILKKIWTISAVSISAQIATFPLGLLYFHQFPNYFLISNLIVIPLAFLLFSLGISVIAFSFSESITLLIGKLINVIVKLLLYLVEIISDIPGALIQEISINKIEASIIYFIIFLLILYFNFKNKLIPYLLFLSTGCLFIINFNEDYYIGKQKMIVNYKIKDHFAMDLINGKNHFFIADSLLLNDKNKIDFFVRQNWIKLDLNDPVYINLDSLMSKTIKWQEKKIAFLKDEKSINDSLYFAIIIENIFDLNHKKIGVKTKNIVVSSNLNTSYISNLNSSSFNNLSNLEAHIQKL